MPKLDFKDYICRPYCRFFKEGEKEEMACQGAVVIEAMVNSGRLSTDEVPLIDKNPQLWTERNPVLTKYVCNNCEFRIDGCDYQSSSPPPDAEPCGGLILLAIMLLKNQISEKDLEGYSA